MATFSEVIDNLGGAFRIIGTVILRPLVWGRCRRWGATPAELARTYPGDERMAQPVTGMTLAVTIAAPARDVWPWIAQLGQERGGMYSYELLENLVGCKMRNATHIDPAWEMHVGDLMRMGPPNYPVNAVAALEREHWLLMIGANPKTSQPDPLPQPGQTEYTNYSWVLYLDQQPNGSTRLISHSRLDYAPRTFGLKLVWEVFTDPIGWVMTRKMLLTIKRLAESRAA